MEKQIHFANIDGNKPIHFAAQQSYPMLCTILKAGGELDINEQNNIGRTSLHEIAEVGDDLMLKVMYKLNADPNIKDKVSKWETFFVC